MVLSVFILTHWGNGLFCLAALANFCLVLKLLLAWKLVFDSIYDGVWNPKKTNWNKLEVDNTEDSPVHFIVMRVFLGISEMVWLGSHRDVVSMLEANIWNTNFEKVYCNSRAVIGKRHFISSWISLFFKAFKLCTYWHGVSEEIWDMELLKFFAIRLLEQMQAACTLKCDCFNTWWMYGCLDGVQGWWMKNTFAKCTSHKVSRQLDQHDQNLRSRWRP